MVYLPSELVREIIELAVPGSFHSTTYRDRLSTLAPLCLVSHQFHAIAQPLLDEIVIFSYDDKIETFPIASMRHCHLYDMGCFPDIDPSRILVDTFVEAVGTARMAIQHVRFTASWWSRDRTIRAEGLALTLTSRPRFRKLETVYLDSEQFSDLDLTLFKAAVHRECPSMSFEVVIEPQARTVSSLNSSISQDFVSRMRKEKSRNTVNGSEQT
ncbi:hypothetical protein JCM3766R1_007194 [Sporobolomyces carnicolor]